MSESKSTLPRDVPRTVDLRVSANLFQASGILVASLVGAIAGYQAVVDGRWIAAAGGSVAGMIVATFISGFVLMFLPQAVPTIATDAWVAKYRIIRRRFTLVTCLCLFWIGGAVAWYYLSLPAPISLIVVWLVLMLVLYAVPHYYVRVLRIFRCPKCDDLFGYRGAFARYPHRCRNCGFVVNHDGDPAK